ncbi:rhodanese-like domain-containing protein [uncultured Cohaesibacter sp.]|uniref:sulfurtransferase n=1 Tax=uncultured Cohaesibacter sp. TaxID=1002546 RepID=UPI0029C8052A|nr:rhodanese-like domain-containing protein [uncultured Cohaesibacter sp.]
MFSKDKETRRKVLLTPNELRTMMDSASAPHILVVQSVNPYTGQDSRQGLYIPNAVETEAYRDFQAPEDPRKGARPLPEVSDLQEAVRCWGLTHDRTIVVYDGDRSMTAARAWWVLKWAGFKDVRVLDGGLPAWLSAGFETAQSAAKPPKTTTSITPGHMPEFGPENAEQLAQNGVLLDARIRPNYIGGPQVGGDPKRGHIPGAICAPTHDTLTDPGAFTDSETLIELFIGLGVDGTKPVGVYCGAGMSAAHEVLALAAVGIEAAMYPGSWSHWINDPQRPVRRGAQP